MTHRTTSHAHSTQDVLSASRAEPATTATPADSFAPAETHDTPTTDSSLESKPDFLPLYVLGIIIPPDMLRFIARSLRAPCQLEHPPSCQASMNRYFDVSGVKQVIIGLESPETKEPYYVWVKHFIPPDSHGNPIQGLHLSDKMIPWLTSRMMEAGMPPKYCESVQECLVEWPRDIPYPWWVPAHLDQAKGYYLLLRRNKLLPAPLNDTEPDIAQPTSLPKMFPFYVVGLSVPVEAMPWIAKAICSPDVLFSHSDPYTALEAHFRATRTQETFLLRKKSNTYLWVMLCIPPDPEGGPISGFYMTKTRRKAIFDSLHAAGVPKNYMGMIKQTTMEWPKAVQIPWWVPEQLLKTHEFIVDAYKDAERVQTEAGKTPGGTLVEACPVIRKVDQTIT